jgi:CRISPR-associated protein Cmr3
MKRAPLNWQTWRFDPWDTWFFKAAEPWDSPGARGAKSVFPPPARTVAGAVRHVYGEHAGVDWSGWARAGYA